MTTIHIATTPSLVTAEHIKHVLAENGIAVAGTPEMEGAMTGLGTGAYWILVDSSQAEAAKEALESEGLERWLLS